jgi:hypothetical protein
MAGAAGNGCLYMVRGIVVAMAAGALTNYFIVIHFEYIFPDRAGRMAGNAIPTCGNMLRGVVGVMATRANSINLIVIHRRYRYPR